MTPNVNAGQEPPSYYEPPQIYAIDQGYGQYHQQYQTQYRDP